MDSTAEREVRAAEEQVSETPANAAKARPGERRSLSEKVLVAAEVFVALTAGGGGIALITGLESSRFPLTLLRNTPFNSYLLPGLVLTVVVGGSAAFAAVTLLRSRDVGTFAGVLAGAILMGWIAGEVLMLRQPSWTEAFYFAIGLAMTGLGLLARRHIRLTLVIGGTST